MDSQRPNLEEIFLASIQKDPADRQAFLEETRVQELIIASAIFDHSARLHSYQLISDLFC